ncbi:APC5 protein [Sporothrix eucalyptigena]|uniref:Anaphase-promoting complex subunit 5 n=1 Tax=Sporothrix eucalyptigena TaxID=1812306 RepID=A0ABP0B4X0_9PEZI
MMRRFISPARIVLLLLVDMYCSDFVVRDEDDEFILELITCYVTDNYARPTNQRQRYLARWQRACLSVDLLSHPHSLQPALQRCFISFNETDKDIAKEAPLRATLWDDLVARLWLRLISLDDMGPFFESLQMYLAPTYAELRAQRDLGIEDPPDDVVLLDRRSPIGMMVYQSCFEFKQLAFAGRCELWEDFVRYRNPTRTDFNILWPHDAGVSSLLFDAVLTEGRADWGERTDAVTRVVFDRMLKDTSVSTSLDETDKLVTMLIERERIGFRPDHQLRDAADHVINGTVLIPSQATFYRLLDAWRMGDINTAYDQLHRYFDLVSRQGVGAAFGYNVGPMNKGVIQRDFGEHSNDLLSMLDAVHAGREARDYNSLRFSLLWLYMYARVLPRHIRPHQLQGLAGESTDGRQVLPYVRDDADASQFHGHHALASLLEARVAISDGRPPLLAKTCLHEAARKIVKHCEVTLEGQLSSTVMLFWDRMGYGPLAVVHGRVFMRNRHDSVPFDDAVRVASRLSLQYAQGGDFAKAKAVMDKLNPEGLTSLKPRGLVRHVLTFVAALQAVRAHRFDEAEDLLLRRLPTAGYPSCAPTSTDRKSQGPSQMDPDLAAQVALLHVDSLARRVDGDDVGSDGPSNDTNQTLSSGGGSLVVARDALDRFEAAYDKGVGDLHVLLQISLARADLFARAGRGMRAVTLMVHTLQACLRRRYHLLLWETVGAVARLLVAEGEFRAARTLLNLALPRSLETGHLETSAQLYMYLVDACMGLAGKESGAALATGQTVTKSKHAGRMKQHMSRAWWYLGQAQQCFVRAGSGRSVEQEIRMKREVILSVSQRMGQAQA